MSRSHFSSLFAGSVSLPLQSIRSSSTQPVKLTAIDSDTRKAWLAHLERMATPVLEAFAVGKLLDSMQLETLPGERDQRARFALLEAAARLLPGIAPWLELADNTSLEAKRISAPRLGARPRPRFR